MASVFAAGRWKNLRRRAARRLLLNVLRSYPSELDRLDALDGLAREFGHGLCLASAFWSCDPEFQTAAEKLCEMGIKMKPGKFILYRMAQSVRDLAGDTVECGSFMGQGSFLICMGTGNRSERKHHIFDSFEGLSAPTAQDMRQEWSKQKFAKHDMSVPLPAVQGRLRDFPWVSYYPGWIPSRFDEVKERRFSLVHIDVDLYQPTRDSLEFFYERMVPGGFLICDDYALVECPGATKAFDDFIADKPERRVVYIGTGQGFIVKR